LILAKNFSKRFRWSELDEVTGMIQENLHEARVASTSSVLWNQMSGTEWGSTRRSMALHEALLERRRPAALPRDRLQLTPERAEAPHLGGALLPQRPGHRAVTR
jgi:hypothetical protein